MAVNAVREWRSPLSALIREGEAFRIRLGDSSGPVRLFAFPLDSGDALIGQEWLCCAEHPETPAISLKGDFFSIRLADLPDSVQSIAFSLCACQGVLSGHTAALIQDEEEVSFALNAEELKSLNSLVSILIYRKGVWRIRCVGQGFYGGLQALLDHYKAQMPVPAAPPAPAPRPQATPDRRQAGTAFTPSASGQPPLRPQAAPVGQAAAGAQEAMLIPARLLPRLPKLLTSPAEVWVYGNECISLGVLPAGASAVQPPNMGAFPDLIKAVRTAAARYPGGTRVTVLTQGCIGQSLQLSGLLREAANIQWQFVGVEGIGYGALPEIAGRLPNVSFRKSSMR